MYEELERANKILAKRFDEMVRLTDPDQATDDLRIIISLGIDKVLARTSGKTLSEAQRIIVNEVRAGRIDKLAHEIAADVQDIIKQQSGQYLINIQCDHGILRFLPDVLNKESLEEFRQWQGFLNILEARCLRAEDPETRLRGRIPYRDGQWLSDMVFKPNEPAAILDCIDTIRGNLMMRGNSPDTEHTVNVDGDIYMDYETAKEAPSFIGKLGGVLRLYADGVRSPRNILLPPEALKDWGVSQNSIIHINDRLSYRFHEVQTPTGPKSALIENLSSGDMDFRSMRFVWTGTAWQRFHRELPAQVAYAILKKFRRICALMGLGDDFIIDRSDAVQALTINAQRIQLFLELACGDHSVKANEALQPEGKKKIRKLGEDLIRLRELAVGEGAEYYRDMENVTKDINEILKTFRDSRISSLYDAFANQHSPIDRASLRNDRDYLKRLNSDTISINDLLQTGGRTLLFINNISQSQQIKQLASDAVADIRETLKAIRGKAPRKSLVTSLLKYTSQSDFDKLLNENPGSEENIATLEKQLQELAEQKPFELISKFSNQMFSEVTQELETDRTVLARCLSVNQGAVDELICGSKGVCSARDAKIFRNALAVNLRSFVAEHLAPATSLHNEAPSSTVTRLLDQAERYTPAIPEFNRICSRTGKA